MQVDVAEGVAGGLQQEEWDTDSSDGESEGGFQSFGIPITVQTPRGGFSPGLGGASVGSVTPRGASGSLRRICSSS